MTRRLPFRPLPLSTLLILPLLLLLPAPEAAAEETTEQAGVALAPYESGVGFEPAGAIDRCVLAELAEHGIQPANPCTDEVFFRRVTVDLTGTLPSPGDVESFQSDFDPERRTALVDRLLESEAYVDQWTHKWADLLRVKAEFPIKLWPNGVQAYHRWIREAVAANMPFDRFARALLTSSGSNFRTAPVNFYRGVQSRTPEGLASAVALTFMGVRFEKWPEARRQGMTAFFSRVVYKPTAEWKEEIVIDDPAPRGPIEAVFPDGTPVTIPPDVDPRRVFADWLITPDNPWFARNLVNRAWSWLFGRGIVHEPDDIRDDNPPSNPALLRCLERAFVASGFDMKQLFRLIVTSRTYQASPIPRSTHPLAAALFSHYIVRRLDAEILLDALCRLDDRGTDYVSIVPEPFTILPNLKRSVLLEDGTITSPFLEMFGRPARDTGLESERDNEPTDAQRLHMLNSSDVQRRIERAGWLRQIVRRARRNPSRAIRPIYLAVLARDPTPVEVQRAAAYFSAEGRNPQEAAVDLAWALINSKEFLYRH